MTPHHGNAGCSRMPQVLERQHWARFCNAISLRRCNAMKSLAVAAGLLMYASTASADISSAEVKRLDQAATVVRELRAAPDKGLPEEAWNRAECVAVTP